MKQLSKPRSPCRSDLIKKKIKLLSDNYYGTYYYDSDINRLFVMPRAFAEYIEISVTISPTTANFE